MFRKKKEYDANNNNEKYIDLEYYNIIMDESFSSCKILQLQWMGDEKKRK